jgi:hypothetical protein
MRRLTLRSAAISCLVALSISIFTAHVFASAMPPLIRAATSNNGQFLVMATLKLELVDETGMQRIQGETFEVSETFAHTKADLTAPNKYYLDNANGWKVELPRQNGFIAPWPIICDDGSSLILVGLDPPARGVILLAIYKKHGRGGKLLRSYKADDLWTLKPGEESADRYDWTPEWFADGKFSFSDDGEMLLYADKEHGVQISLKDGTVTKRK